MFPTHPKRRTLDDSVVGGIERMKHSGLRADEFTTYHDRYMHIGFAHQASFGNMRHRLQKKIMLCVKWSVILSLLLALLLYSRAGREEQSMLGATAIQWFHFIFVVLLIEVCTATLEDALFFSFEWLWRGSFRSIYYAQCLHGPSGHFLTVVIVVNVFGNMRVPQSIPRWRTIVTTTVAVLMLYTLKGYWQRRHFVGLLELRFREKLQNIDACQAVLTILARPLPTSVPNTPQLDPAAADRPLPPYTHPVPRTRLCLWPCGAGGAEVSEDGDGTEGAGGALQPDKFWERMDCIRCGDLVVTVAQRGNDSASGIAHNGQEEIRIRSKREAISFGKRLFQHLARHSAAVQRQKGEIALPSSLITSLIRESYNVVDRDEARFSEMLTICLHAGLMFGYTVSHSSESAAPISSGGLLQSTQRQGEQVVSEERLVAGVCSTYRTLKQAATSMANLQDLHRSVTDIADMVFWVLVLLLMHTTFGLKTFAALTPLLTIVFGLSFALGPAVGNLCLAVVFVMFMLPYDVGNRVCIAGPSGSKDDRVIGNVAAITLGYTTIATIYNEKLRIPNHILFYRSITNMNESANAVFEIIVQLPLSVAVTEELRDDKREHTMGSGDKGRIDLHSEFWQRMEASVLRDREDEWRDMAVLCRELQTTTNTVQYAVWLTHRAGWHETKRINRSRSDVVAVMYRIQRQLGLTPIGVVQPLTLAPSLVQNEVLHKLGERCVNL